MFTERCEQVVKMAENATQDGIRNCVNVRIITKDANAVAYTFSDTSAVIDTAHDFIIELPSTIQHVLCCLSMSYTQHVEVTLLIQQRKAAP